MSTGYALLRAAKKRDSSYCKKNNNNKKNIKKKYLANGIHQKKIIYKISPAWNTA